MSLTVRPDPERPTGGFAILALAAGPALPDAATVSIMETFGGKWLAPSAEDASGRIGIGDPNWQPIAHEFGPYPLRRAGDRAELTLGPEIVNKIEGYTNLRLHVAGQEGQISWPDDIMPLAGARGLGGLQVGRKPGAATEAGPRLRQNAPELSGGAGQNGATATAQDSPATVPVELPAEPAPRRTAIVLSLAALALGALAAGLWFWSQSTEPAPVAAPIAAATPAPTPDPPPAAVTPAKPSCSRADLAALPGGFAALRPAVAACGAAVSADDLMSLLEDAVAAGNGEALLVMGKLYDPASQDPDFEGAAAISLSDTPAQAAEYYARARTAGNPDAAGLLTATCQKLVSADDVLSQGAYNDFCH